MSNDQNHRHRMAVVSLRTGLRPDLIRAWERRYSAVLPRRTSGSRRLYSDRDVHRLVLLRRALEEGWRIGQVAYFDDAVIERLLRGSNSDGAMERPAGRGGSVDRHLRDCFGAILDLDGSGLQARLDRASLALSRFELMDKLLAELVRRVADGRAAGSIRTAHEHLASVVLQAYLNDFRAARPSTEAAPCLLVTTPFTEHQELGALLLAAAARCEDWNTTYLGPNLPAEEIAAAARVRHAKVIAMNIAVSTDTPVIKAELRKLGRLLDGRAEILVEGHEASTYQDLLESIGATRVDNLTEFREFLNTARVRSIDDERQK